ncbi:hypothetical protein Baya_13949 [Bagarius yarrelli]|uniref:Uncharacterized protein n=1 Tax=Bagarius yarrelli TaxID=175774 RepID=A0A556V7E5_BAGYA|nr:hypothetical protein Baya_13949 [Bagarius yarrelli]
MVALVAIERHLWCSLTNLQDQDEAVLLDFPISLVSLFDGPDLESLLDQERLCGPLFSLSFGDVLPVQALSASPTVYFRRGVGVLPLSARDEVDDAGDEGKSKSDPGNDVTRTVPSDLVPVEDVSVDGGRNHNKQTCEGDRKRGSVCYKTSSEAVYRDKTSSEAAYFKDFLRGQRYVYKDFPKAAYRYKDFLKGSVVIDFSEAVYLYKNSSEARVSFIKTSLRGSVSFIKTPQGAYRYKDSRPRVSFIRLLRGRVTFIKLPRGTYRLKDFLRCQCVVYKYFLEAVCPFIKTSSEAASFIKLPRGSVSFINSEASEAAYRYKDLPQRQRSFIKTSSEAVYRL